MAAIMIQGTGSNVGKSLVCAGLCRLFADQGLKVAPFKPQNMSNNAAVTHDGGEIGRAQAVQAYAARRAPHSDMNPVLLKPESEGGAQLVLGGQRLATLSAAEYARRRAGLMPRVLEAFARLSRDVDLVVVEGAGSPAEINLRTGDIANMGFAGAADIPVLLCADIDRGGVIASLVGTHCVLQPDERARICGYFINRFRGDVSLFASANEGIGARTGWPCLGIVPWFSGAARLPAEDVLDLAGMDASAPLRREAANRLRACKAAILRFPRIANFDEFDPLRLEPALNLVLVEPGTAIPGDCDIVFLPGSKATMRDLEALRAAGWEVDLRAHLRRGGRIFGICGGFQMLGTQLCDPLGIESQMRSLKGLGFMDFTTTLAEKKRVTEVTGRHLQSDLPVTGYEIHCGRSTGRALARPFIRLDLKGEGGAAMHDGAIAGHVAGTYIHGLFANDAFRRAFLALSPRLWGPNYGDTVDGALDELAAHLARHLDCKRILALARSGGGADCAPEKRAR